jgi:hypothetical protein
MIIEHNEGIASVLAYYNTRKKNQNRAMVRKKGRDRRGMRQQTRCKR